MAKFTARDYSESWHLDAASRIPLDCLQFICGDSLRAPFLCGGIRHHGISEGR